MQATNRAGVFPVSALTGEGVAQLLEAVSTAFEEEKSQAVLTLGFAEGKRRSWLHDAGIVLDEAQDDTGWQITVLWTERQQGRYREFK